MNKLTNTVKFGVLLAVTLIGCGNGNKQVQTFNLPDVVIVADANTADLNVSLCKIMAQDLCNQKSKYEKTACERRLAKAVKDCIQDGF